MQNGNAYIALSVNNQSFKFTGLDQLEKLGVGIPQHVTEEINRRRVQIGQNEEKTIALNNSKASKQRTILPPNPQSRYPSQQASSQIPNLSGANSTPIGPRMSMFRPPRHTVPSSQANYFQQLTFDNRSKAVKRPLSTYPSPTGPPSCPQTQNTFRYPQQPVYQSPQFPYPQSYWTTPPPGEGIYMSRQQEVNAVSTESTNQFKHSTENFINSCVWFSRFIR